MVSEREWAIHQTRIYRWVQESGPELDQRCPSGNASLRLTPTASLRWRSSAVAVLTVGNPQRVALSHRPHLKPTNNAW